MSSKQLAEVERRVVGELERNPLWQLEVLGHWLCPYCGSLAEPVQGRAKSEVVVAHLVTSCPGWRGFRGAYIPMKTLRNKSVAILIQQSLSRDPAWKVVDDHGCWYCPYCSGEVQLKLDGGKAGRNTAIQEAIRDHMSHCYKFQAGKGQPVPAKELRKVADRANKVKRLAPRVRKILNMDERWRKTANDGSWICPICFERIKSVDITTELLRNETAPTAVSNHLLRACQVFLKVQIRDRNGNIKPPENLEQLTDLVARKRNAKRREKEDAELTQLTMRDNIVGNEGFKLSVNIEEDEATSWDAINNASAPRVNSASEKSAPMLPVADSGSTARLGQPSGGVPKLNSSGRAPGLDTRKVVPDTPSRPASRPSRPASRPSRPVSRPSRPAPVPPDAKAGSRRPPVAPDPGDVSRHGSEAGSETSRIEAKALQRARKQLLEMIGPVPGTLTGYEFGAIYRPSGKLDGDFFYFFELGMDRYAVAAWEISKPGLEMVPINRHFVENLRAVLQEETSPKQALNRLNERIYGSTDVDTYVSVVLAIVDTRAHTVTLANAGFQPVVIYNQFRSPEMEEIRTNGIVLGSDYGALFMTVLEERTVEIMPQDQLVIYSSGVIEFRDTEGNAPGIDKFNEMIREFGKQDTSFFLSMTDTTYKRLAGGEKLNRDMVILAIKRL